MRGIVLLFVAVAAVAHGQVLECPTDQDTDWSQELLLRHEDCNKFYKCTHGEPVEYKCYGDLYFNLETWQCDWQENVDCEGRNDPALTTAVPTTPEPTTPEPTTPEPTTPEPTTPEPTTPEPTTPVPTTPEPTTPEPITPKPTTTTAAPTEAPTAAPTTKEPGCEVDSGDNGEEVETDFLQNGCPADPHVHWLLPHEEDCNLFYYCVWGKKVLRECPSALHFNPTLQVCDWAENARCAVSFNKHFAARRHLLKQILG